MTAPYIALIAGGSAVMVVVGFARLLAARPVPKAPRRARRRAESGLTGRFGWARGLARRLERGGIALSPEAFLALVAAAVAAGAFLVAGPLGLPLMAPAAAALVVAGAAAFVRAGDRRRLTQIEAQLPQTARTLAASLAAGLSLRQALVRAARDLPEPLAGELRDAVDELRLGARIERVLEDLMVRIPARDLRVMVTAILVQRRTGGDLAGALALLAERLDERVRLARELRGATAQARLTAWMVAALPAAAGIMAEFAAPGTLRGALGRPPGSYLALCAIVMYGVGVVWVRRIGRVEV